MSRDGTSWNANAQGEGKGNLLSDFAMQETGAGTAVHTWAVPGGGVNPGSGSVPAAAAAAGNGTVQFGCIYSNRSSYRPGASPNLSRNPSNSYHGAPPGDNHLNRGQTVYLQRYPSEDGATALENVDFDLEPTPIAVMAQRGDPCTILYDIPNINIEGGKQQRPPHHRWHHQ